METKAKTKTHWLQNPNKNYLGHWDLAGREIVLTIKSAQWEAVRNPIINTEEEKRVVRFYEKVKPFICNETNAKSILKSTGIKFMEDVDGAKIQLFTDTIIDKKTKETIDCIRVRDKVTIKNESEIEVNIKKTKNRESLTKIWGEMSESMQVKFKDLVVEQQKTFK